ncbi:MAG: ATP-binding protein [Phycisphaerales bacterium]|nr:ATP-binding protein [Phycisphaerales bacterium]
MVTDLITNIADFEILSNKGQPYLSLVLKSGPAMPVATAGDGVRLLLTLSFELAQPEGGLVLMEEPETHLHPAAIFQASRAIRAAADRKIQIVATTHSLDFIDALIHHFQGSLNSLAFYKVRLEDGKLLSYRMSGEDAAKARTQIMEDLR